MSKDKEGVIKFNLQFETTDVVTTDMIAELTPWREKLFDLKLIGQNPSLYDGLGYGNISRRLRSGSEEFVITGSQTSHLSTLNPRHYAIVLESFIQENKLIAKGLTRPSSEALTHASFYQASPEIYYVFHVHSALIWQHAEALQIPVTASHIAYGTPEMALEINNMFTSGALASKNIVAMGGHKDGVIAFGSSADETGKILVKTLNSISQN